MADQAAILVHLPFEIDKIKSFRVSWYTKQLATIWSKESPLSALFHSALPPPHTHTASPFLWVKRKKTIAPKKLIQRNKIYGLNNNEENSQKES